MLAVGSAFRGFGEAQVLRTSVGSDLTFRRQVTKVTS